MVEEQEKIRQERGIDSQDKSLYPVYILCNCIIDVQFYQGFLRMRQHDKAVTFSTS